MQFRRDLASPLSEVLGVMVLCGILWFGGRLVLAGTAGLEAEGFIMYVGIFTQIINPANPGAYQVPGLEAPPAPPAARSWC